MPTPQQIKDNALSTVNGVMTALEMYPETESTSTYLSNNISSNPIDLLVDFFKSTKGYDFLVDVVSKFIILVPTTLEVAVKGILLTNIQSMLSCSIKPLISEKMIKEGVVFDMNRIDLFNIFSYSPIDHSTTNPGRYYYFGCNPEDNIEIIDDVKYSTDFNAVLWYCKNNPGERVVWKRKKDRENNVSNIAKTVVQGVTNWTKQPKSNGIVTLQYNGRSSGLTDSENHAYYIQEPMENCLHVFYGCNVPIDNGDQLRKLVAQATANINDLNSLLSRLGQVSTELTNYQGVKNTALITNNATTEEFNAHIAQVEEYRNTITTVKQAIYGIDGRTISDALDGVSSFDFSELDRTIDIPSDLMSTSLTMEQTAKAAAVAALEQHTPTEYPSAKSNYYYRHLMMEFNYDFVMSMKLFDEKVLTAQLIDALTNCLKYTASAAIQGDVSGNVGLNANGNINISFQQQFVEAQLRETVTRILESDDSFVSDCFFTFTNEAYNNLLQEVEMSRAGLNTNDGSHTTTIPSAEELMSQLNSLTEGANKEELQTAIKGSIYKAASCTTPHGAGEINTTMNLNTLFGFDVSAGFDANWNANFIEQLLTKLVYTIVMIIMSPKVYVLLMANLKVVGQEPNFDLNKFIQQFGELIRSLITGVRDEILEFLRKELLKIMQELASQLTIKLTVEQYQYYIELLIKTIDCMKIHGNEYDWAQDDVHYADITELSDNINQEC